MIKIPQIKEAERPAILFSGGKDSLLLLDEARKLRPDITVIHFYDHLQPQVERIIKLWDLDVLSWRPSARFLIPWDDGIALSREYSFGDGYLPVVQDVEVGGDCEVERLLLARTPYFDYPFDKTIWGYKAGDERHPVMGKPFPIAFGLGPTLMIAPLYHWTDEEVLDEIGKRNIPYEPFSDQVHMCEKCFLYLGDWDRESSLQFFARRYGFREAA